MGKYIDLFKQDAQRWVVPQQIADPELITPGRILGMLIRHPGLRMALWLRFGSWCRSKGLPLVGPIQRLIFFRFGMEVSPGDHIAGGFYVAHPNGCVVFSEKIGRNCTIIASVTFGMRNEHAFPVIGDNVFIGTGARVLGGIRIGDDAVVGANAVVIKDVPDGATVVGIPAKIIKRREIVL
jgi:serine O-acetyltransferase